MKLALMFVNVDINPGYEIKPLGYCRPQPVLNSVLLHLVKRKKSAVDHNAIYLFKEYDCTYGG